jgi:tetratricopeptide (TPR) repeat protein
MRQSPAILPLIMLLTVVILTLLAGTGLVSAVRNDGQLPGVAIEYGSRHRRLLSPANVESGIADLAIAAQLDFDSPDASARLLQAAEQTENPEALVAALRGFLANDRDDPALHEWLAAALLVSGDAQQALVHSEESLRLAPDAAGGLVTHGNVLASLNRTADARAAYEKALKLEPENELARQGLERLNQADRR